METLQALDRRIRTARTVRSLVRTMKNLAAASIRHYEEAAAALDGYAEGVELGFQAVLAGGRRWEPERPAREAHLGAVVFGSAQGLAGRFNERVAAYAAHRIGEAAPPRLTVAPLGPYVGRRLEAAGIAPGRQLRLPSSVGGMTGAVGELLEEIDGWVRERGVTQVLLFYNSIGVGATFTPQARHLLPLDPAWLAELSRRPWPSRGLPAFTMDRGRLFAALVREYLFVSCFRAFARSLASEQACRLSAMQVAQRNLDERLEELWRRYHQRRQTAITEELLDLATAVEALRGENGV